MRAGRWEGTGVGRGAPGVGQATATGPSTLDVRRSALPSSIARSTGAPSRIIAVSQLRVASSVYWQSVVDGLYLEDLWMGLIKPFFLGFVIVTIGCHVGLRTRGGTQGVGRATTSAVVAASVTVLVVDFFVTRLLISVFF